MSKWLLHFVFNSFLPTPLTAFSSSACLSSRPSDRCPCPGKPTGVTSWPYTFRLLAGTRAPSTHNCSTEYASKLPFVSQRVQVAFSTMFPYFSKETMPGMYWQAPFPRLGLSLHRCLFWLRPPPGSYKAPLQLLAPSSFFTGFICIV